MSLLSLEQPLQFLQRQLDRRRPAVGAGARKVERAGFLQEMRHLFRAEPVTEADRRSTRQEFHQRFGFDPRNPGPAGNEAMADPEPAGASGRRASWDDYRRQKITDLVKALRSIITLTGKDALLTAAVKPNVLLARNEYYQDWPRWLQAGLLDYALPMNYTPDTGEYSANITSIMTALPLHYRDQVIMGVAIYNQDARATAEKIRAARLFGFGAVCIFSYDAHKTNLTHFDPIIEVLNR